MVTINLLPWREYERHYQAVWTKKLLLFAVSLVLIIIFSLHFYASKQVVERRQQVMELQNEIDKLLEKQRLFLHKKIDINDQEVEKSQINYHKMIQTFLLTLGKKYEEDICFTDIARQKNTIIFSGNARSATDLTAFLKHWKATSLFSEIKIEQLQYQSDSRQMQFRFQAFH